MITLIPSAAQYNVLNCDGLLITTGGRGRTLLSITVKLMKKHSTCELLIISLNCSYILAGSDDSGGPSCEACDHRTNNWGQSFRIERWAMKKSSTKCSSWKNQMRSSFIHKSLFWEASKNKTTHVYQPERTCNWQG